MARKVNGEAVQRMRRAGIGRKQEVVTGSWAEAQAAREAAREARRLEREAEADSQE